MSRFKDDNILIIAPGSRYTHAQLGLPESYTPARNKFKTRMFPAEKPDQWEPHKIRRKNRKASTNGDAPMTGTVQTSPPEYEEDLLSDEGAVWPIQSGRIIHWPCFYALLQYIHNTLSPTLHTPILMIAEPAWTAKDHERITQYCFESFKCPGFVLLDAASAACYAFGLQTACVVDVGADKANVTTITDYLVDESTRAIAVSGCGGEGFTSRLQEVLGSKGFTRDMCEQLKRSAICEILPPGVPLPGSQSATNGDAKNPAALASTGAEGSGAGQRLTAGALGDAPRGPGVGTEIGGDDPLGKEEDNEGVLDVAAIVASGKMNEYLERKEKEKQEKAAARAEKKKGNEAAAKAEAAKRMKNSEKEKATFFYEDNALLEVLKNTHTDSTSVAEAKAALDEGPQKKQQPQPDIPSQPLTVDTTATATAPDLTTPMSATTKPSPTSTTTAPRREITVGTERLLQSTDPSSPLQLLSSTIHRVITSSPSAAHRSDLWNNLIFVGNGAAIRGFKEALLALLHTRFLVTPQAQAGNGNSMFTSALPSGPGTPSGTGANTPIPGSFVQGSSFLGQQSSSANPLLVAATSNSGLDNSAVALAQQTPTSMRLARLPEYFPEWKEVGSDEASFLGAQIAAKMVFIVDQSQAGGRGYMTRADYNDQGPGGVHDFLM